jgi:hypothetical protein
MPGERLYMSRASPFCAIETGRHFHVNGITVNKTIQTVESAAAGGALRVGAVNALIDSRFPLTPIGHNTGNIRPYIRDLNGDRHRALA